MARQTIIAPGALAVEGLDEIVSGLRRVQLQKAASEASQTVADFMKGEAQDRWAQQPIRRSLAHKTRGGPIGKTGTQKAAGVVLRYSLHPYAAGVEFGSLAFRQFRRWRGNRFTVTPGASTGYVVQDAIADNINKTDQMYGDAMLAAIARAIDRGL